MRLNTTITFTMTLIATLLVLAPASAATLHVPADYPTIQSCIDAAVSGQDECVVAPGTYKELINFLGKAITLRSSHGSDITTIDGTGLNGYVLTCTNNETSETRIDDFTILGSGMENNPGSPTITNCKFIDGEMWNEYSDPTIIDCTFLRAHISNSYSTPTITDCVFRNGNGYFGGAIDNYSSGAKINNCIFIGNTGVNGGAISNGNREHRVRHPVINNCIFIGNSASYGGAIYNGVGYPTLNYCTFTGNNAEIGGAIYNSFDSLARLNGSIFWSNSPQEFGGQDGILARYTDIDGGYSSGSLEGVIDQDPLFVRQPTPGPDGNWDGVDDDYGDLRLQTGSPCINTGDPNFVPAPGETDLDGHARVLCGRVDMGAYEFGIGDFDCNQVVNLLDFASVPECSIAFGTPYDPGCEALDFEFDGDVDLADFAQLQRILGSP